MDATAGEAGVSETFRRLIDDELTRVQRAVIARFGGEIGAEVAADTREWAWANRTQVTAVANPAGLLFRVAQSRARTHTRWANRRAPVELVPEDFVGESDPELIDLFRCLSQLTHPQRVAVVLVHAHGERYDDVAELLGISTAAVTNHVHRGLKRLRKLMGE